MPKGLTGALALPMFAGEYLNAVLVIFFGDGDDHAGAIELWHNDPAASKDMTLSRWPLRTHGRGLRIPVAAHLLPARHRVCRGWPGMAACRCSCPTWARPRVSCAAKAPLQVGINRGFALACTSTDGQHHVAAFLSALDTPIVRRFEVWQRDGKPSGAGVGLLRDAGRIWGRRRSWPNAARARSAAPS